MRGWRRSGRTEAPAGVEVFTGDAQRDAFLAGCDTLINLLPLTEATRGVLSADLFARLPRGAHLINVGRGEHVVEADLLAALDSGQLVAATLDAFATEPLPADHPFWAHPQVTLLPHVAAQTDERSAAAVVAANIRALADGAPLAHLVRRDAGY